ncbi:copper chaperone PCu(A)C [Aestuariivirga litoralis]|uniref:copper chaperone PCu(A)C n=1 Tax=Aestuariivirga litoralis TaxID=2650924 RepID=UPI0018C6C813|nr:copper chaperone PCu(A)C [Aestuariivirga litoralis]MBG1232264.1 copper chaperone PCu(A)C [Aestuariivirga litoralis]
MKLLKSVALATALFAVTAAASAHEMKLGNLVIHHPWIKPAPAGSVAAAYTVIDNKGSTDDKLISVTVEGVPTVMIHDMKMVGDVMKMDELKDGLPIPAGQTVEVKPKSFHIMLMGLKSQFMEGEEVKGTLTFEKAGKLDVDFEVVAPGADDAGTMAGMKMK